MTLPVSTTRGGAWKTLLVFLLLVPTHASTPAAAQQTRPSAAAAVQRRLARISQKLDYLESRLLADEAVAAMAQSLSAQDAALAVSVTDPPWLPSTPLKGRIVFEHKNCDRCHAISGAGGSTGPDLAKTFFRGSFLDLASMLWNHIPDMLVEYKAQKLLRPTYTEEEVTNLISYLYYLRYLGNPGDVSRGEKLLEKKNCGKCHLSGEDQKGLGPGFDRIKRYASPLELAQALWNHEPKMHDMMRQLGIPRPTFTGQEISDLSAFVRAASRSAPAERIYVSPGNPQDGARVYAQKGCAGCHSADHPTAPALASMPLHKSAADIAGLMWNHGEQMFAKMQAGAMAWPVFEGKEMADLIAYLYFVKFIEPPGNAVVGKTFFQEKKCGACHSIQGVGGSVGPDLARSTAHTSNIAILTAMLNHAETMSEAILKRGDVWPLLNGQEMRDTFAYIKAVSGIKNATVRAALRRQTAKGPLVSDSPPPRPSPPVLVPRAPPPTSPAPPALPLRARADESPSAGDLPAIPAGYQLVEAMLETAPGDSLIEKLKESLGEEQLERVKLAFQHSPEFISKAGFTWTPRHLKGGERVHVFVPALSQAGLTVQLQGKEVWSAPEDTGQNILSPKIDLGPGKPNLSITVDDRSEEDNPHGGVDDIYVLRPKDD